MPSVSDHASMFDELVAGHADLLITDGLEADDQAPPHWELAAVPAPFTRLKRDYDFARAPLMKELIDTWIGQAIAAGQSQRRFDRAMGAHK